MKRYLSLAVFCVCVLLLAAGCPDRRFFTPRFQAAKKAELIIDGVESAPDNPVLLCGDEDLGQFLRVLVCADGKKLYTSLTAGLEREDLGFSHTSGQGYQVRRFEGACYKKSYEFFLTVDACDVIQQYE